MKTRKDRTSPRPAAPPVPARRFRIEKLEERIAPKKKGASPSDSGSGFSKSVY